MTLPALSNSRNAEPARRAMIMIHKVRRIPGTGGGGAKHVWLKEKKTQMDSPLLRNFFLTKLKKEPKFGWKRRRNDMT